MARPTFPATAVAVSLAMLTTGEHAIAQGSSELEVRLEAGSARSSATGAYVPSALAFTPALRFASSSFSLDARGAALHGGDRWQLGDANLRASSWTASVHGLRAEVLADASRTAINGVAAGQQLDLIGRLHLIRGTNGAWVGSGVIRPLRVATVSNASVNSGGVWTRVQNFTLRATVTAVQFTRFATDDTASGAGTVSACPVTPTATTVDFEVVGLGSTATSCRRESRLTDLEGGVRWEHHRTELNMRGGRRFGHRLDVSPASRLWGSGQAAIWLSSGVAAVVAGGREPGQPTRGIPARRFASLGFMLAHWPIPRGAVLVESPANLVKSFELRPAGEALQRLTVRIGRVERVEIMGDFSDWAPVTLERRGRDQWEMLIPMSPGIHHINMRIDGGKWVVPPGIPSIRDDFNGEVGVLVIKP